MAQLSDLKRILIGRPFPTSMEIHERVDKVRGLAIFASDPISSNAYATEAIMTVLVILGSGALALTLPLALAVAVLVLVVVFSYVQTILHYPQGGGGYIVTKDNLGTLPSLVTAAALLSDYALTVSVSASAGVRAITSAFPDATPFRVELALLAILVITWINLRGVRESGSVFAIPTYAFIGGLFLVLGIGLVRAFQIFGASPLPATAAVVEPQTSVVGFAYIWLLLRAFAGGCTALTGIEAISDGVRAFKPPEAKNAAQTMIAMGVIAMTLFIGISFLSTHLQLVPSHGESILSQMARQVTGGGWLYYWVQVFTTLILILAANTGFQDFPRLSSFLARDGFLPRWMQNRGDRLVFSSGIIVLAIVSSVLVVLFQADEIAMLPLYAIGVMLSFSLSQASMATLMGKVAKLTPEETLQTEETVLHYEDGVVWKRALSLGGSLITSLVFLILVTTKFREGAWIIVLAIPALSFMFLSVKRHYERVARALRTSDLSTSDLSDVADVVIVPIADVHRGTLRALKYARRLSRDVRAVVITTSPEMKERFLRRWKRFPEITNDIQLVTIEYDFRDVLTPIVEYIEHINNVEFPELLTTVVIPEFIPENLLGHLLHNQTANSLRFRLRNYRDIVVIDLPFHITGAREWRSQRQVGSAAPPPPSAEPEARAQGDGPSPDAEVQEAPPEAEAEPAHPES